MGLAWVTCLYRCERQAEHRRKACIGVLRMGLRIKQETELPAKMSRESAHANTQSKLVPSWHSEQDMGMKGRRGLSHLGVCDLQPKFKATIIPCFYFLNGFILCFPAHKQCTLVSTEPLCLCKLF